MIFLQICCGFAISYHCYKGEFKIQEGISEIKNDEYYGCSEFIGNLVIPDSIKYIGKYSFYNCYGFTGILTLPKNIISIDDYAFYNCHGFTGSLTIPNTCTHIGKYLFSNCTGFISLNLPTRLQSISSYSFSGCSGFKGSLSIGKSVTKIEKYAFSGCSGFDKTLTFSSKLKTIEEGAFFGCSGFVGNVELRSVKVIGKYAFYGCSNITSISLNLFIKKIGEKSFYNCKKLRGSLTIPRHIQSIGKMAFGETNYKTINYLSNKNEIFLNEQKKNFDTKNFSKYKNQNETSIKFTIIVVATLIIAVAMCCFKTDDPLSQKEDSSDTVIDNSTEHDIMINHVQKTNEDTDIEIINNNDAPFSINDINEPRYSSINYIPKTSEIVDTKPNAYSAPPPPNYPSTDDDGDNVEVELSSTD